jgi:LytR cell envelope-related transcriptional attenuator
MRGSSLRLLVMVAAVVAGIAFLAQGFEGPPLVVEGGDATPPGPSTSTPPPPTSPTCEVRGVIVAVYNGTQVSGLARGASERLMADGYVILEVGDAASSFQETFFYWRNRQARAEAECLRDTLWQDAHIERLPQDSGVPEEVQVAIYLGADYAAANPVQE